ERAKYELGTKNAGPAVKRSITDYAAVPELAGTLSLWWYPIEGVQVHLGYSAMAFFNTVAGRQPVDFDYGSVAPPWERTFRFFDGLQTGIGFIF
ncbi:MAG TPA: hypothetical protein VFA26_12115, partial [Gemmataceae bacterium]|nr:hypothetical protein [Gemmataceae bacterium]